MKQAIALTVDAVVFSSEEEYSILLIKRKNDPFKNQWALPGGFVEVEERLEEACKRELAEETDLQVDHLEFVSFYDEINRDPRGRTVSAAFTTILTNQSTIKGKDDASDAKWFFISELDSVKLAFDHAKIIQDSLEKLKITTS